MSLAITQSQDGTKRERAETIQNQENNSINTGAKRSVCSLELPFRLNLRTHTSR